VNRIEWLLLLSPWAALITLVLWDSRAKPRRPSSMLDEPPYVDDKHRYEKALADWTKLLSLSTIALVAATIINAYILHQTDDAIHRQLEVMQREQEPLITVAAEQSGRPLYDPALKQISWNFVLRNVGKGIARQLYRDEAMIPVGQLFTDVGPLEFVFPGGESLFTIYSREVDANQAADLLGGDKLAAMVSFRYVDALDQMHVTAFCWGFEPKMALVLLLPADCKKRLGQLE
jgi:hypothetical protein